MLFYAGFLMTSSRVISSLAISTFAYSVCLHCQPKGLPCRMSQSRYVIPTSFREENQVGKPNYLGLRVGTRHAGNLPGRETHGP